MHKVIHFVLVIFLVLMVPSCGGARAADIPAKQDPIVQRLDQQTKRLDRQENLLEGNAALLEGISEGLEMLHKDLRGHIRESDQESK